MKLINFFGIADPGCFSRIPDPNFLPIPDPGSLIQGTNHNKKKGRKTICCHTFFCSHKFHKIENYFIFEILMKKIWPSFQRIIGLFT
jgi:hypothetical protein